MFNIILCKQIPIEDRRPGKAPEEIRTISTAESERAAEKLAAAYEKLYQERGPYKVIAKEAKNNDQ